jgi:hypothetical protein
MSDRIAGSTTLARRPSLASANLITPVMNRFMPVMKAVIPANEPLTPVKVGLGTQRSQVLATRQDHLNLSAG